MATIDLHRAPRRRGSRPRAALPRRGPRARRAPGARVPAALCPAGQRVSSVSGTIDPLHSVPVTTVPNPLTVKTRSMGRRAGTSACRDPRASRGTHQRLRRASRPSPVRADTRTIGAEASGVPATRACTSDAATACIISSARSHLVKAITPLRTSSSWQMSRCSRVCGITDSSAATTSSATSMPPTPASIVRTKRSCPGTSTNDAHVAEVGWAKPSSMLMPRACSSGRRSGLVPVSASTSALLP